MAKSAIMRQNHDMGTNASNPPHPPPRESERVIQGWVSLSWGVPVRAAPNQKNIPSPDLVGKKKTMVSNLEGGEKDFSIN
jgi:hypothetical protein